MSSPLLFIADVHLSATRPALTALFRRFLARDAAAAAALYILGDLFETWIGDDDPSALGTEVAAALRQLSATGVALYVLHGNRDFLLGAHFATASGAQLLPETSVIEIGGAAVLLLHGDTLCIDDVAYQALRAEVRNPLWQEQILRLPLEQRRALAGNLRESSRQAAGQKALEITDVNQQEVERVLRSYGVQRMIHGHTHRPALHTWQMDGQRVQRAVLGDWQEQQGSVLRCDAQGWRLENVD